MNAIIFLILNLLLITTNAYNYQCSNYNTESQCIERPYCLWCNKNISKNYTCINYPICGGKPDDYNCTTRNDSDSFMCSFFTFSYYLLIVIFICFITYLVMTLLITVLKTNNTLHKRDKLMIGFISILVFIGGIISYIFFRSHIIIYLGIVGSMILALLLCYIWAKYHKKRVRRHEYTIINEYADNTKMTEKQIK